MISKLAVKEKGAFVSSVDLPVFVHGNWHESQAIRRCPQVKG